MRISRANPKAVKRVCLKFHYAKNVPHVQKHNMMELSPRYCDIIISRWEGFTGKSAVRVE